MYFFSLRQPVAAALFSLLIFLTASAAFAKDEAPINIEADRMVSQENKNTVVFIGNVEASQGKVTIRADEMTVQYEESAPNKPSKKATDKPEKGKSSKVKSLICIGSVEVTQGDWLGTGEKMEYGAAERKVVLSGNAKAWQDKNMVSGKTITYYLDEKRSVVENGSAQGEKPGRVKATIQQQ
jgi:lipopolysaccharide export system protein LptA